MQTGIALADLAQRVIEQGDVRRDYLVNTRALQMLDDGRVGDLAGEFNAQPTDHFHTQLAHALEIPTRYYNRMRENDVALLAHNANAWLQRQKVECSACEWSVTYPPGAAIEMHEEAIRHEWACPYATIRRLGDVVECLRSIDNSLKTIVMRRT